MAVPALTALPGPRIPAPPKASAHPTPARPPPCAASGSCCSLRWGCRVSESGARAACTAAWLAAPRAGLWVRLGESASQRGDTGGGRREPAKGNCVGKWSAGRSCAGGGPCREVQSEGLAAPAPFQGPGVIAHLCWDPQPGEEGRMGSGGLELGGRGHPTELPSHMGT